MPMVYDLPTADMSPAPLTQMKGFEASESKNFNAVQLQEQGNAVTKAGGVASQIANSLQDEIDTAATKELDNKFSDVIRTTLYDPEKGYLKTAGKDALTLRQGATKTIQDAYKEIEKGARNDVQKLMLKKVANQRMQTAALHIDSHAMNQAKVYNANEAKARMDGARMDALNNWAGWEDPSSLYSTSKALMVREAESVAEIHGIAKDSAQYKQLIQASTTQLHSDAINLMISQNFTTEAKNYFNEAKKKGEILPDKMDDLGKRVKIATTATEADNLAAQVWDEFAPKDRNSAVSVFQMSQRVRELAGDNEEVQKAAISGIKERAGEFNAEQSEYKSQNIAGVWKQIDSGVSMKQIQTSQSWLNLSDTERHQIRKELESEQATRAARGAAEASRKLSEIRTKQELTFYENGDAYLTVTDPNVLKKMSRAQVEAQRGKFGIERTQHLLDKWDSIQNPAKYGEAKMDSDDFNQIARTLNLDPYNTKNKEMRNTVGALKFHVEQVISYEQSQRKAPLTRQEKMDLVNREISKQVLVNPGILSFNKKVPVIALTKKQAEQIVIPPSERKSIAEAMKIKGIAPTEANLRNIYLRSISPGGAATFQGAEE